MLAIFLGAALLFWNEGRTLHTRRALSVRITCFYSRASMWEWTRIYEFIINPTLGLWVRSLF